MAHLLNFMNRFKQLLTILKDRKLQRKIVASGYLRQYGFKNEYEFLAVLVEHFFETPKELNEKASKKAWKEDSPALMNDLINVVKSVGDFSAENLQTEIKSWITSNEIGFGKVMQPLRLAMVGDLKGPDLFQIMFMVGKDETIRRIENLVNTL